MESVLAAAITGMLTLMGVLDPASRAIVVALCMAVLSPVMAEIGKHLDGGIDVPRGGEPNEA